MDAELLRKIGPEELQNGAWMKKDQKVSLEESVFRSWGTVLTFIHTGSL